MSAIELNPVCSKNSAPITDTATGVSTRLSFYFLAVTTISSRTVRPSAVLRLGVSSSELAMAKLSVVYLYFIDVPSYFSSKLLAGLLEIRRITHFYFYAYIRILYN